MSTRPAALLLSLVVAASIAACSSGPGGKGGVGNGTLTVADAWVRPSTGLDVPSAAYLTIANGTAQDDALLSVSTPAARSPEIHQTSADESGMMAMHPVDRIEVPAGQTVKLQPGGFHIMLIDLTGELVVGSTIDLTLTFENAGEVKVSAVVRAS
jgi:hypothetical protein